MTLRLGTLCLFENPSDEPDRALIRQFVLVREADRMGYDDIWLVERHGDPTLPSGAITALLGHLTGVTSKARIGAVLQPSGRNAVQLAEDLATVELLSRGRLALAADAQAEAQDQAQHKAQDKARDKARDKAGDAGLQALAALRTRLGGTPDGLVPRPSGRTLPAWAMTDQAESVRHAALLGLGLWLPPTLALADLASLLALYSASVSDSDSGPMPLLTRYACPAASREEALAIARPYLESRHAPGEVEALLAQSLVGSHAEVAAQIKKMEADLGLHGVVVVPMSAHFDTAKHILADMVDEVRPLLDE